MNTFCSLVCVFLCCSITVYSALPKEMRADGKNPRQPWLQDIEGAVGLDESLFTPLMNETFVALSKGKRGQKIGVEIEGDTAARVVILSVSDTMLRPRSWTGTGFGLKAAVENAVDRFAADDEKPDVKRIKLDVVQHTLSVPGFTLNQSPVPFPGLSGIGFSPASGMAFSPDQLAVCGVIGENKELLGYKVQEMLLLGKRWHAVGLWKTIAAHQGGQTVFMFECQSFYADQNGVRELYRGHVLPIPQSASSIKDYISKAAQFSVDTYRRNGSFVGRQEEWGDWLLDMAQTPHVEDFAGSILSLLEAAKVTGKSSLRKTASEAAGKLAEMTATYEPRRGALCFVNEFDLTTDLSGNALSILVMLEFAEENPEFLKKAMQAGNYLFDQLSSDGKFIFKRKEPPQWNTTNEYSVRGSSMAVLALLKLYEKTGEYSCFEAAEKGMGYILKHHLEDVDLSAVPADPWLIRALNQCYTFMRDKRIPEQTERIAAAMQVFPEINPAFPDFIGSCKGHPSATLAANLSESFAVVNLLLDDMEKGSAVKQNLSLMNLSIMFHLQAMMDKPRAFYMDNPNRYPGALTMDCLSVRLGLASQWQQLHSLCTVYQYLEKQKLKRIPLLQKEAEALRDQRERARTFPQLLKQ